MILSDLCAEHIGNRIMFESYGLEHTGILSGYLIAEPKKYTPQLTAKNSISTAPRPKKLEYAPLEYWHHNCQIEIINNSYGIDVPIIYTSLGLDTSIRLEEHTPVRLDLDDPTE